MSEANILTAMSGDAGLMGRYTDDPPPAPEIVASMLHEPTGQGSARYGRKRVRERAA